MPFVWTPPSIVPAKAAAPRTIAANLPVYAYAPAVDTSWLTNPPPVAGRLTTVSVSKVFLFYQQLFNDTLLHNPVALLPLEDAEFWSFEVQNLTDQDVTLTLIGGATSASFGSTGAATSTVTKGSIAPYVTNIWMPYEGLAVQYASAPSTGTLTITGTAQPKKFQLVGSLPSQAPIDLSKVV